MNCISLFVLTYLSIPFVSNSMLNVSITFWETSYLMMIVVLMGVVVFVIRSRDKVLTDKHRKVSVNQISIKKVSSGSNSQALITEMKPVSNTSRSSMSDQITQDVSKYVKKIPA